jgi:hypothetical protein
MSAVMTTPHLGGVGASSMLSTGRKKKARDIFVTEKL